MKIPYLSRWKEAHGARHEPEVRLALYRGYWAAILSVFVVTTAIALAYGVWEFTRPFEKKNESEAVVAAPKAPLHRADLQEALESFDERAVRFEERQGAPALAVDPS